MCLDLIKSNIFKRKSSGTNIPLQKEIPSMPEVSTSEVSQKQYSSLLKPYTNFDNIKDMSIDELAEFIDIISYSCSIGDCENCTLGLSNACDKENIINWLKSEVTR